MSLNTWETLEADIHLQRISGIPKVGHCLKLSLTLPQAKLASGHNTFMDDPMFYLEMSDEQVREIDPGNDLYPFMVAASGETCDLSAVYSLLRRNPALGISSS
jgi:hypothetical protein